MLKVVHCSNRPVWSIKMGLAMVARRQCFIYFPNYKRVAACGLAGYFETIDPAEASNAWTASPESHSKYFITVIPFKIPSSSFEQKTLLQSPSLLQSTSGSDKTESGMRLVFLSSGFGPFSVALRAFLLTVEVSLELG